MKADLPRFGAFGSFFRLLDFLPFFLLACSSRSEVFGRT